MFAWAPGNQSMANQWLGPWISITGLQETIAGKDINGWMGSRLGPKKSKARLGWAPGNHGWAQEIRKTMAGPPRQPATTGDPEINGWAQIKSRR